MVPHPTWLLLALSIRSGIVLVFLVAGLRLLGKRQLAQFNIYDLAMVLALGNAVQNAMTSGRGELTVGLVSAATVMLLGKGLSVLFTRRPALESHLIGSPTLLVQDGRVLKDKLRRECVTEDQVLAALREHGVMRLRDAHLVVLEVDGTLSVVPREDEGHHAARKHSRGGENPPGSVRG